MKTTINTEHKGKLGFCPVSITIDSSFESKEILEEYEKIIYNTLNTSKNIKTYDKKENRVVLKPKDCQFKCGKEFTELLKDRFRHNTVKIGEELKFGVLGVPIVFIVKETNPKSGVVIDEKTTIEMEMVNPLDISFTYSTSNLVIEQGKNKITIEYKQLMIDDIKILLRNYTDIISILLNHI